MLTNDHRARCVANKAGDQTANAETMPAFKCVTTKNHEIDFVVYHKLVELLVSMPNEQVTCCSEAIFLKNACSVFDGTL